LLQLLFVITADSTSLYLWFTASM